MKVIKFADTDGLVRYVASDAIAVVMDEGNGVTTIITRDGAHHMTRAHRSTIVAVVWVDQDVEIVDLTSE